MNYPSTQATSPGRQSERENYRLSFRFESSSLDDGTPWIRTVNRGLYHVDWLTIRLLFELNAGVSVTSLVNKYKKVIDCVPAKFSGQKEGNCKTDSLKKIWEQKFTQFRQNIPSGISERCKECPNVSICRGGCWLFRAQGMNP